MGNLPLIKTVRFGKEVYIVPSLSQLDWLCFNLAKQILAAGYQPQRVIALAKGGLAWIRTMADYLGQEEMTSIQIQFYGRHMARGKRPVIIHSLPVSVVGEKVLIFDDVAETGESLSIAKGYLENCGAKTIRSATLFVKPKCKTKPDFVGLKVNGWVVFPHELRETIGELVPRWERKEVDRQTIRHRLEKLGITRAKVDFFLQK